MCRVGGVQFVVVCLAMALALAGSGAAALGRRTNAHAGALVARMTDGNAMAMAVDEHLGSHAQLIARINHVAAQMRVEQHRRVAAGTGARVRGTYCRTVVNTQVQGFVKVLVDSMVPLADWLPPPLHRKAVSLFLGGEASAKAFVGIEANIGMGFDIISNPPVAPATEPVKTAHLFACLGASVSTGHYGAGAMAGGGIILGFGRFKETVLDSNAEIGVELALGSGGGVSILLKTPEVPGAIAAFNAWRTSKIGAQANTPAYTKSWFALAKSVAKGGASAVVGLAGTVQGVHVVGGVGMGVDVTVSVSGDFGVSKYIAEKLSATFPQLKQQWIKGKNAFAGLGKKIVAAAAAGANGAKKVVTKWTPGAVTDVRAATAAATDDFEEAELTEAEMAAAATAAVIMDDRPSLPGGRRGAVSADTTDLTAASAAAVINKHLPPSAQGQRRGAFSA